LKQAGLLVPQFFAGLAAVALLAMGVAPAAADDLPTRQISVDATVAVGTLRPLSGVQAVDAEGRAFYRSAHVDLVRIPDRSAADIDAIFPDKSADVENPKSYNFAAADKLIASIKSGGAEPLFRLGGSVGSAPDPPADPEKWAQIARHIVLHYNVGWARGFRYGIRYWEVWNAPDSKAFWSGSPEEYYSLYEKTARAIESADPSALVGGPGLAKPLIAGAYREKFMDFVRTRRLPLDFFAWHFYAVDSNDPYTFVSVARQLRIILDSRGFGSTKNVLDEWSADPGVADMPKQERAAFAASSLIYMLGGPIDAQTYHAGAATGDGGVSGDPAANTLSAFGALKDTPMLIRTTGGDEAGLAVVAGRSKDNRLVQILISNYQVAAKFLKARDNWDTTLPERRTLQYGDNGGYDATVTLPGAGKYQMKRYRIDASAKLTLLDQSVQNGPSIRIQAQLPPPAVELIVISAR
jgi:xylan 1,4-beta-xylosidase